MVYNIILTSSRFAAVQAERLSSKCLYFVRVNPKGIAEKTLEADMAVGEMQGSLLDTFKSLLSDLFLPLLHEQSTWGKMPPQHTRDFLAGRYAQGHTGVYILQKQQCARSSKYILR